MSTRDIAKKYKTAQTNVRRLLAHYEIPTRKPGERTEYFNDKMRDVYASYSESYKQWRTKTCEWCGKEFQVDGAHKRKKFCSEECLHNSKIKQYEHQFCELCGKDLGIKRYKVSYCNDCLSIHRSESQFKRIETECAYCHKKILAIPSRYNSNKYLYCDVDCMAKHYAEIYTGENSPSWKGGKRHYTGGWLNARDEARERDNYTCAICGITEEEYGHELSVHHIKKYRDFEDKNEANQLSNLISLCEPCHRFVHSNDNTEKIYLSE